MIGVKEEDKVTTPKIIQLVFEEFPEWLAKDLPNDLPPLGNIQHHIYLVPRTSLPKLPITG